MTTENVVVVALSGNELGGDVTNLIDLALKQIGLGSLAEAEAMSDEEALERLKGAIPGLTQALEQEQAEQEQAEQDEVVFDEVDLDGSYNCDVTCEGCELSGECPIETLEADEDFTPAEDDGQGDGCCDLCCGDCAEAESNSEPPAEFDFPEDGDFDVDFSEGGAVLPPLTLKKRILQTLVLRGGDPMSTLELAEALDEKPSTVRGRCSELVKAGLVVRLDDGKLVF